ncbi:MAG: hypothetical protein ACFFG0_12425, partial [Candidatus Thorarchaeota archaeon]
KIGLIFQLINCFTLPSPYLLKYCKNLQKKQTLSPFSLSSGGNVASWVAGAWGLPAFYKS